MPAWLARPSLRCAVALGSGLLCVLVLSMPDARAQGAIASTQTPSAVAAGRVSLGDRGWSDMYREPPSATVDRLAFSVRGGLATDYVYRGTTLSDRKPAVGAGIEATFGQFYAGATAASVKLPTEPSGEFTVGAGVRPKIG